MLHQFGLKVELTTFIIHLVICIWCYDIVCSYHIVSSEVLCAHDLYSVSDECAARIYEIGSTGISSLQGHSEHRSQCMNHFVSLFGYMPLVSSHVKVVNAQHQWFW